MILSSMEHSKAIWYSLGIEEGAWRLFNSSAPWFAAIGTFVVAAISADIAIWQIRKQYKNAEKLQREHKKDELKWQLYKEIAGIIEGAILELIKIQMTIFYSTPGQLKDPEYQNDFYRIPEYQ